MAIIGIGGGGKNIVGHYLGQFPNRGRNALIIGVDEEPYKRFNISDTVFIPHDWMEKSKKAFMSILEVVALPDGEPSGCYVVVAGLGGETGSSLAPLVLEILRKNGLNAGLVATTPFHFEGPQRRERTREVLDWIGSKDYPAIIFPNGWLFKNFGEELPMNELFEKGHGIIDRVIEGLMAGEIMWDSPMEEIREYAQSGWPARGLSQDLRTKRSEVVESGLSPDTEIK